jgi:exosortase A
MSAPVETSGVRFRYAARGQWPYVIGVVLASLIAVCLIFRQETVGAVRVWSGSATYNHCFLILPISLYMIWQRRDVLASVSLKPELRAVLLIPLLSLAWLGASVFGVLEAQQFVAMTIIQAMLLAVLGWPIYRRLMAPLLYLYFLVPSGDYLVPYLQDFTARFAVLGLQLLGIPVFSDGTMITVPAGNFTVAEACAGLRFLIASIAFGVFYASEIYDSWIRRTIFIGLSIVVPIIANGFRALGLIAAAEAFGNAAAVEADHITYGWVFFSLVLLGLIFIGRAFSDRNEPNLLNASRAAPSTAPVNVRRLAVAALACVGFAAVGPAFAAMLDAPFSPTALQAAAPALSAPWRRLAAETPDWHPVVVGADRQFQDSYTDGADRVDRFVALYAPHGRSSNLIRANNRIADLDVWNIAARGHALTHIGGKQVPVTVVELVSGRRRKLVWSFYAVDGATGVGVWEVKRLQVHAYLTGNGCPGAYVAAAVDAANRSEAANTLDRYFAAMEPLPPYLCDRAVKTKPTS